MNRDQIMDQKTVKKNQIKLIAIFAVAVIPVVLAMSMYFGGFAIPSTKTNKGNLIWPPVQIDALNARAQMDKQLSVKDTVLSSKKWTLLITGSGTCDQRCEDLVHTARQVNVSMAKEMDRVSRVLVSSLTVSELHKFEEPYPNLIALSVDDAAITSFEAEARKFGADNGALSSPWKVWIVDPLGNVIIQYTDQHDGYDMIHDLKKLLKLSNIG